MHSRRQHIGQVAWIFEGNFHLEKVADLLPAARQNKGMETGPKGVPTAAPIPAPEGFIGRPLVCSRCRLPAQTAAEKECRACGALLTVQSGPSAGAVLSGVFFGVLGFFFLILSLHSLRGVIILAILDSSRLPASSAACLVFVVITVLCLKVAVGKFKA